MCTPGRQRRVASRRLVAVRAELAACALTLAACAPSQPHVAATAARAAEGGGAAPATLPYETLEQVRYRLLEEQDTDCDQKITVLDRGSRRFRFRLLGESHDFSGAYQLANVLSELSLARRAGAAPRLDRVDEDPIARTSRAIRAEWWPALTRRLDEDGLPAALEDSKLPGGNVRRLYVPSDDPRAAAYYQRLARRYDGAYAALGRATAGLGASELGKAELGAMLATSDGRESIAELLRRLDQAASALDYPGLAVRLRGAVVRSAELLEQAGRGCVNAAPERLAHTAARLQGEIAAFAPKTLEVRTLPERSAWPEWSSKLGAEHGLLSLAVEERDGRLEALPFVVPGGRFNEMYGWDSYFILLGTIADERLDLARGLVENAAYEIEHYGAVLNANRTYYLTRAQPPFFAAMVRAYWEASPEAGRDGAWLARMLRAAQLEHEAVWSREPRSSSVCRGDAERRVCLARYAGLGRGQPPEVEPGHFDWLWQDMGRSLEPSYAAGTLPERNLVAELDAAFEHDRCMRESGHDTTYRWFWSDAKGAARPSNRCADMLTVDLNSLLYRYEVDLAFLQSELDAKRHAPAAPQPISARTWCARASNRFALLLERLWSPRAGLFFDALLEPSGTRQTGYVSATALYPLWATEHDCPGAPAPAGFTPALQSALVTNALAALEAPGGLLASAQRSRERWSAKPDRQWDYPNGWAPHQMLAWYGLAAHGFRQDAERLIGSWLYMVASLAADHNGTVPEKYDVVARTHAVFSEYGNVGTDFDYIASEGFGWVNASFEVGLARLSPEARRRLSQSLVTR
jgi:alpha,alpha-trehalase